MTKTEEIVEEILGNILNKHGITGSFKGLMAEFGRDCANEGIKIGRKQLAEEILRDYPDEVLNMFDNVLVRTLIKKLQKEAEK